MRICKLICIFSLLFCTVTVAGQKQKLPGKIKVAVRSSPPFIMESNDHMSGVSVDLWETIAPSLGLEYEYIKYHDLGRMLSDIENDKVDLCINPLTVTSDRLSRFSFTQPYYISGTAIAVNVKEGSSILAFIRKLFSRAFMEAILLLFLVIFVFGFLIWVVERHKNPDQFGKGVKGLGHGIWWSAVTMTTVGYGDKAPSSGAGRFISIIWMFTAVIIISSFTASISAALTYNKLRTDIRGLSDLQNARVGTVKNSSTASYLSESRIRHQNFNTLSDAMDALVAGNLEAVVYDEPLMRYLVFSEGLRDKVELIPSGGNSVYFSFASSNLELIQKINPQLIEAIEGRQWRKLLETYNLRLE